MLCSSSAGDHNTLSMIYRVGSDYSYHQMCTFLFRKPTLNNCTIKCACYGENLGWVTSYEVFQTACKGG